MKIYMLRYEIEFDIDRQIIKTLGVFDEKTKAESAKKELSISREFKGLDGSFWIVEYDLNQREWKEGFFTD